MSRSTVRHFRTDALGATMVEYALMLALIAVVALLAVQGLGIATSQKYACAAGALGASLPGNSGVGGNNGGGTGGSNGAGGSNGGPGCTQ